MCRARRTSRDQSVRSHRRAPVHAAPTERIRLTTGAVLPVFHHPVQLAAHIAMVDAISGGRAWLPYEFEALGVPIDESRPRFEATARALTRRSTAMCNAWV